MNLQDFKQLRVGDRIEFRAITRNNSRKQVRVITDRPIDYEKVWESGAHGDHAISDEFVTVRFEGTPNFFVRRGEIIRVVARAVSHRGA